MSEDGLTVSTGGTSGSFADIRQTKAQRNPQLNFVKRQIARWLYISNGDQSNRTDWYQVGSPRNGQKGFAPKVSGGSWYLSVHNGSLLTETSFSGPFRSPTEWCLEFNPGSYLRAFTKDTLRAEITSGLPSGMIARPTDYAYCARLDNSAASDKSATIHDYRLIQEP